MLTFMLRIQLAGKSCQSSPSYPRDQYLVPIPWKGCTEQSYRLERFRLNQRKITAPKLRAELLDLEVMIISEHLRLLLSE